VIRSPVTDLAPPSQAGPPRPRQRPFSSEGVSRAPSPPC
jgi:hypothetical protein